MSEQGDAAYAKAYEAGYEEGYNNGYDEGYAAALDGDPEEDERRPIVDVIDSL